MQVILSHNNLDFDALASMIAAGKLHPEAVPVLPSRATSEVEHFITIYKNIFPFLRPHECEWDNVESIILVDTSYIDKQLPDRLHLLPAIIYDHHVDQVPDSPSITIYECEAVGATITLLSEHLKKNKQPLSPLEATVFALGLYSDTESFTLPGTTARDLEAGAFFLHQGANLKVVDQFREVPLTSDQQHLFQKLLEESEIHTVHGIELMTAFLDQEHYTGHLAHITRKLLQISGLDGVIAAVRMGKKVFVTSRAQTEQVDFRPLMSTLGGGGHAQAASASSKDSTLDDVRRIIEENLETIVKPALTARDLMTSPVRVIAPETTVETASKMLYRYGHSGFPVAENEKLTGIISRRDIDKALHHGLGHAPVKGFMQRDPFWIKSDTRLETIRSLMMEEQIGRLPVLKDDKMIGIVSRTDLIEAMHGPNVIESRREAAAPVKRQVTNTMERMLAPQILQLLKMIQKKCEDMQMRAYLIGGIVRDMFLNIPNEDLDIVVEGDAIKVAEQLQIEYGGKVRAHEIFRTATWSHSSGCKIDLTSARTEYYDFPAALPDVEPSTIKEDLFRRDFTVNTLAVSLNKNSYGELTDYFQGLKDIYAKRLKVLYNLSFVEDPTRILRALRFEARFGFRMDPQTKYLAEENMELLASVSYARLADELSRLFLHSDPRIGAERLIAFSVSSRLFSETIPSETTSRRIRRLYCYEKLMEKAEVIFPSSKWMGYLIQFLPSDVSLVKKTAAYGLNKQDKRTAETWVKWMENESMGKWSKMNDSQLHRELVHFEAFVLVPFINAFAPKATRQKLSRYLYRRETITSWLTGKDLIESGFKPDTCFSAMLFEAELLKMQNPGISKSSLIEEVRPLYVGRTK
ncbi:CBS domain-containing protein [Alkalicoccus halolimnae]|uniref:CBS domain-containing protein n=1 Tax=Alkalicoccus halolimnae TaxID=1667239 RepID=A0A5C7FGP8_9BACI|nr:CBS domain-containing protein [Alkalicoccus halolimnae]TXF86477.1 CBS domain-containing protein [Alkalicoccus halolimnae]